MLLTNFPREFYVNYEIIVYEIITTWPQVVAQYLAQS